MIYLQLFFAFFKTGLFAIGGGLATLPFLYDISETYGWFSQADIANMLAVSESTPGPIGVNMATYCGIQTGGLLGGIVATFALVLPAFLMMLIAANLLKKWQENAYVQSVMRILRPTSVGLIAAAFCSVVQVALLDVRNFSVASFWTVFRLPAIGLCTVLAFMAWRFQKLHPIFLILIGAVAGILLKL